jgi:hypothetical protein
MKASLEDTVLIPSAPDDFSEDGRSYNREAVAKIRDTWMYKQVRVRQHEFTQFRQVHICNVLLCTVYMDSYMGASA